MATNEYEVMDFKRLTEHFGMCNERLLLKLFEVDKRTLKNWIDNNKAPVYARKLLTLYHRGMISEEWQGWYFEDDKLHSPIGQRISAGQIKGWFYQQPMIEEVQRNIIKKREENERLKRLICANNDSIFREDGKLKQNQLV